MPGVCTCECVHLGNLVSAGARSKPICPIILETGAFKAPSLRVCCQPANKFVVLQQHDCRSGQSPGTRSLSKALALRAWSAFAGSCQRQSHQHLLRLKKALHVVNPVRALCPGGTNSVRRFGSPVHGRRHRHASHGQRETMDSTPP